MLPGKHPPFFGRKAKALFATTGFHFGDWLAYSTDHPAYSGATTSTDLIATALQRVAGIRPLAPGYRRISITPRPGGGLTNARARHQSPYGIHSPYGIIESSWMFSAPGSEDSGLPVTHFRLSVTVPPNTRASVRLPNADLNDVTETGRPLADAEGLSNIRHDGEDVVAEVAAGRYAFTYSFDGHPTSVRSKISKARAYIRSSPHWSPTPTRARF